LLALDSEKLWEPLAAGGVDLKLVPGTHEKVLEEPYVQALAKELSVCLSPRPVELLQVQAA
jgi:thioesterase domain-containing protein